jgi:hypothetical protein
MQAVVAEAHAASSAAVALQYQVHTCCCLDTHGVTSHASRVARLRPEGLSHTVLSGCVLDYCCGADGWASSIVGCCLVGPGCGLAVVL